MIHKISICFFFVTREVQPCTIFWFVSQTRNMRRGSGTVQNATRHVLCCGMLLVLSGWPRRNIESMAHIKILQNPGITMNGTLGKLNSINVTLMYFI
jgi:hypothetical protein